MNSREFLDLVQELYAQEWPRPLNYIRGASLVDSGASLSEAAKSAGTNTASLKRILAAHDRLAEAMGLGIRDIDPEHRTAAIKTLGQLLVGQAAERAFVDIYREEMETHELVLQDLREGRTDTDYRLYNGQGRPVYRINIKFHGARFLRAVEMVGLEPHDCFALATYKIYSSLNKQTEEGLPYIFAIVGVPSLSGESVGGRIPSRFVEATAYIYQSPRSQGKRGFEDRIVGYLSENRVPPYEEVYTAIHDSDWFILSARRADHLVHQLLYDRVYALRIPRFTQQFRFAEVDMHFSLSRDLTPLRDFLGMLREEGHAKVVTMLERGVF